MSRRQKRVVMVAVVLWVLFVMLCCGGDYWTEPVNPRPAFSNDPGVATQAIHAATAARLGGDDLRVGPGTPVPTWPAGTPGP